MPGEGRIREKEADLLSGKASVDFVIRGVPAELQEGPVPGWRMRILYSGPTAFVDEFLVHAGELAGHLTPHPPHRHDHEELHIALSDQLEYVTREDDSGEEQARALSRGSVFFTDSHELHTFRNTGDNPAPYLHLRWRRGNLPADCRPGLRFFHQGRGDGGDAGGMPGEDGENLEVYSGPSRYFSRITLRSVTLPPGGAVPMHRHAHEVAFVLVGGAAEILGRRVEAPGFAFMRPWVPHCLHNPDSAPAWLYALEFHPPS